MKKVLLVLTGMTIGIILSVMLFITADNFKYCKQVDELTVLVDNFNEDYNTIDIHAEMEFHDDKTITIHIFRNGTEFVSVSPHVFYETWIMNKVLEEA